MTNNSCLACSSREISVDLKAAFENTVLNRRFFSWEDVEQAVGDFNVPRFRFLNTFSLFLNVHLVIKGNFRGLVKETNRKFNCNYRIFRSKYLDCKSMLRVVLNVNEYIFRSYIMTHNHPCTKSFMRCDPWFRRSGSDFRGSAPAKRISSAVIHVGTCC
uniref:SJCHGC04823 protein n=1 Tax=Schistosoma japonicum TaxID=6182 RepID=Q5D998_SCHJA|nr:SJCHGC04823 protein [Schistosoma japonicum]